MSGVHTQQQAMAALLIEAEGHQALHQDSHWQQFLKTEAGQTIQNYPKAKLTLYEELLFLGVEDTLSSFFPNTKRWLETKKAEAVLGEDWAAFIERYRRAYPNRSHKLFLCGEAFSGFIAEQEALMAAYPFLAELAEYEWLEVDAYNALDPVYPQQYQPTLPSAEAAFTQSFAPFWNNSVTLAQFQFPIPRLMTAMADICESCDQDEALAELHSEFQEAPDVPTSLVVYRDPVALTGRYFELTVMTGALMASWEEGDTFSSWLNRFQSQHPELQAMPTTELAQQLMKFTAQAHQAGILLGSYKA